MNTKKINVSLSVSSLENAIKELKQIKSNIRNINREIIKESLSWIQNRANKYLEERVGKYPNSANVGMDWHIKLIKDNKGGNFEYQLINKNDLACFVEFGTGLVGSEEEHKLAEKLNYQYDMNNHGEDGWEFAFEYGDKFYYYVAFKGYKGKSFLYDAFFDFYYLEQWKKICQKVYDKYIY